MELSDRASPRRPRRASPRSQTQARRRPGQWRARIPAVYFPATGRVRRDVPAGQTCGQRSGHPAPRRQARVRMLYFQSVFSAVAGDSRWPGRRLAPLALRSVLRSLLQTRSRLARLKSPLSTRQPQVQEGIIPMIRTRRIESSCSAPPAGTLACALSVLLGAHGPRGRCQGAAHHHLGRLRPGGTDRPVRQGNRDPGAGHALEQRGDDLQVARHRRRGL